MPTRRTVAALLLWALLVPRASGDAVAVTTPKPEKIFSANPPACAAEWGDAVADITDAVLAIWYDTQLCAMDLGWAGISIYADKRVWFVHQNRKCAEGILFSISRFCAVCVDLLAATFDCFNKNQACGLSIVASMEYLVDVMQTLVRAATLCAPPYRDYPWAFNKDTPVNGFFCWQAVWRVIQRSIKAAKFIDVAHATCPKVAPTPQAVAAPPKPEPAGAPKPEPSKGGQVPTPTSGQVPTQTGGQVPVPVGGQVPTPTAGQVPAPTGAQPPKPARGVAQTPGGGGNHTPPAAGDQVPTPTRGSGSAAPIPEPAGGHLPRSRETDGELADTKPSELVLWDDLLPPPAFAEPDTAFDQVQGAERRLDVAASAFAGAGEDAYTFADALHASREDAEATLGAVLDSCRAGRAEERQPPDAVELRRLVASMSSALEEHAVFGGSDTELPWSRLSRLSALVAAGT